MRRCSSRKPRSKQAAPRSAEACAICGNGDDWWPLAHLDRRGVERAVGSIAEQLHDGGVDLEQRCIVEAAGPDQDRLRDLGLRRAAQFTWGATAAGTLDVYREAAGRRRA